VTDLSVCLSHVLDSSKTNLLVTMTAHGFVLDNVLDMSKTNPCAIMEFGHIKFKL